MELERLLNSLRRIESNIRKADFENDADCVGYACKLIERLHSENKNLRELDVQWGLKSVEDRQIINRITEQLEDAVTERDLLASLLAEVQMPKMERGPNLDARIAAALMPYNLRMRAHFDASVAGPGAA